MEKIFIGVPWPYTNGDRHLGHVVGMLMPSDITARYHRLKGDDVLMVSGSDMHGTPTTIVAEKEGVKPEEISQKYHERHMQSFAKLGISYDLYTSTATKNHKKVTQELFLSLKDQGYLVEKEVKQWYCSKCDRFLPDRYVEGTCPHCGFKDARGDQCDECGRVIDALELTNPRCKTCGGKPEVKKDKQYFFTLSKFEKPLKEWLEKQTHWRKSVRNFALAQVEESLPDRAITRSINYGVPVPVKGYEDKRIYVWFEAVIGYLSAAVEYSEVEGDLDLWESYWKDPKCKHFYFMGKDNIIFHAILWPAMLMAYDKDLSLPYNVGASQFLTLEGKQFSVSRGYAVWLHEMLETYDPDMVRYALTAISPERKDTDFSWQQFYDVVNNELIATYGNFANRVLTFVGNNFKGTIRDFSVSLDSQVKDAVAGAYKKVGELIEETRFQDAQKEFMSLATLGNKYIDDEKPWESVKGGEKGRQKCANTMYNGLYLLNNLRILSRPFIPFSAQKLSRQLGYLTDDQPEKSVNLWQPCEFDKNQKISPSIKPLFERLDPDNVEPEVKKLKKTQE